MPLSASKIRSLESKPNRYKVADSGGLAIEVLPSGIKSWRMRYRLRGKPAEINLGRYPVMGLADARIKRDEMAALIRAGSSPIDEKRKEQARALKALTVREFSERYYKERVLEIRKDPKSVRRYLSREVYPALGLITMLRINSEDLREIIFRKRNAGHPHAAVALRNLLKRIWDYAMICGVATVNPAHAIPIKYIAQAKARTRTLSEPEIGIFLRSIKQAQIQKRYKAALEIILLTLVRKSELRQARWEYLDFEKAEWLIRAEDSKTSKEQVVYLSHQAMALFTQLRPPGAVSGCVFPMVNSTDTPIAPGTLNAALRAIPSKLKHHTIHDLRRTGATRLSEMGYQPDVVEKALNHKLKGVRGIYNRAEFAEQRREMLQVWADHLDLLRAKSN